MTDDRGTEILEDDQKTGAYISTHRTAGGITAPCNTEVERTMRVSAADLEERASSGRGTTRFGLFSERRDVDSVIEATRQHRNHQTIDASAAEEEYAPVSDSYEMGKLFAEGGQGVLSFATDKKLRRLVAVKSLRRELTQDEAQRKSFIAEAKITAQLDHPAVIPIYSLNTDEDHDLHLAMKLINGQSFKHYLEQICTHYRLDGVHSFDEHKSLFFRLEVFLKVCDALEYAHSRNIMHCDLKPENIMIGEYREVYIMDWGIARLIRDPAVDPAKWVRPRKITGTPRFLSPEAINGDYTDQRADIFALGLILFEAVTLQEAFFGTSSEEVVVRIRDGKMTALEHRFGHKIDADLKAIIRKASAYDREDRYQSVSDLSSDLRKYLQGNEVSANPDHCIAAVRRFAFKHQRFLMIFVLICFLFGTACAAWSLVREIRAITIRNEREFAVGTAYARCAFTSQHLDKQFSRQALVLESLASENMLLLGSQSVDPDNLPSFSYLTIKAPDTAPSTLAYSPVYRRPIDFYHPVWKTMSGKLTASDRRRIGVANLLQPIFLRALLTSPLHVSLSADNQEKLKYQAFHKGVPLHMVLFGYDDGLYIAYPGNGNYSEGYDPRNRHWYQIGNASADGSPCWGKPYLSFNRETGYLLPCAIPLLDASGKRCGVAAVDLLLSVLIRDLRAYGNRGTAVLGKYLIDGKNNLILSTDPIPPEKRNANTASDFLWDSFPYPEAAKLARERQFGSFIRNENGREILYCFTFLHSLGWIYLERLDFGMLIRELRAAPPDVLESGEKQPGEPSV